MRNKKGMAWMLSIALVLTAFSGVPSVSYGVEPQGHFMEGITFTKTSSAGYPETPSFEPGSGAAVTVPLFPNQGIVPGFYVEEVDHYVNGETTKPEIKFACPDPIAMNLEGWTLQSSADGSTNWQPVIREASPVTTTGSSVDIYPEGEAYYRLASFVGGKITNVAQALIPAVQTDFRGWETGANMGANGAPPIVGCVLSADAKDVYTTSGALTLGAGDLTYQWYKVNPATFEMTSINGATSSSYSTTNSDVGYRMLCKISGDGVDVGGYMQLMPPTGIISVPVRGFVSNTNDSGFILNLENAVAFASGQDPTQPLDSSKVILNLGAAVIPITAVTDIGTGTSGGAVYQVEANLSAVGATDELRLSSEDIGIVLGAFMEMPPAEPPAGDGTNLISNPLGASVPVEVTSVDTDQVYYAGNEFSCELNVSSIVSDGAVVRVAIGGLGAGGSINPFHLYNSTTTAISPFQEALTLEENATQKYYYTTATAIAGAVSISGTLVPGVNPSAIGMIVLNQSGSSMLSNLIVVEDNMGTLEDEADDKQVMFGIDNVIPETITVNPAISSITDLYNIPAITFGAMLIDGQNGGDVIGNMSFTNLNLMKDWNEIMIMGKAMMFNPIRNGEDITGFEMGMDETQLVNFASNPAILSITGLETLESLINGNTPFLEENFIISGPALDSQSVVYEGGVLSFGVGHFSSYEVSFSAPGGGEVLPTNAALTVTIESADPDNVFFPGQQIAYSISGFPEIYNGNTVRVITGALTEGSVFIDKKLFADSVDGDSYWYDAAVVTNGTISITGTVTEGWDPSRIFVRAYNATGEAIMAPVPLMRSEFYVANGTPVNPEAIIGLTQVKVGFENGIGGEILSDPIISTLNDLYHIPQISLIKAINSTLSGIITFQNVDIASEETELAKYVHGINIGANLNEQEKTGSISIGVLTEEAEPYRLTSFVSKSAIVEISGLDQNITLDQITITEPAQGGGLVITQAALSSGTLSFGVNHFSSYVVNISPPGIKVLTIGGITIANKTYDGTTTASISGTATLGGIEAGDDVTLTGNPTAYFTDKNAGNGKQIIITGLSLTGADAGDYDLLIPEDLTANILVKALTASAINKTKAVGDNNPAAEISYEGFVNGETVTSSGITPPTASYTANNASPVGTYPINLTGGSGGNNYSLSLVNGTLTVVRSDIALEGIDLVKASTSLLVGVTETLAVTYTPTDASIKGINWSSANAQIATVDSTGKITGVSAGTTTITAVSVDGGFTDSCSVTVNTPITLTSSLKYSDGTTIPQTSGVYQVDGTKFPLYDSNLDAPSDNKPMTLTVTGSGTLINDVTSYDIRMVFNPATSNLSQTATTTGAIIKNGFVKIIPRVPQMVDGTHSFEITMLEGATEKAKINIPFRLYNSIVPVTGITMLEDYIKLSAGETYNLNASVVPSGATDKTIIWSSTADNVATVTNGAVTGVGAGTTTISAVSNHRGYEDQVSVVVGANITGTVYDDGVTAAGVWVYLYEGDEFVGYSYTDQNGAYSFSGVEVGNYVLLAASYSGAYKEKQQNITVSAGDTTKSGNNISFESPYPNRGTISVNVLDEGVAPYDASEVYVSVYSYETGDWEYRAMTTTEKAIGTIEFTNLRYADAGTIYNVSVSTSDFWSYSDVTLNAASVSTTYHIPVRYSIGGRMMIDDDNDGDGDTGVANTYLTAIKSTGEWYYGYTDPQGYFSITGLVDGSYEIHAGDISKYSFTPAAVTVSGASVTGQSLIVTIGADLIGRVQKGGVDAYKAYLTLNKDDGNDYGTYVASGVSGGSGGFVMTGAVKTPGFYKLHINYVGLSNGTYPPFVSQDVTFEAISAHIEARRIQQNITYADVVDPANIFTGTGNGVVTDVNIVRQGSTANLIIKYKNNGNTPVTATFTANLPANITSGAVTNFTVTNLAAGASGQQSFALNIGNVAVTYPTIPVVVNIGGQNYDFGTATLEMAGITLSGPGAVKTNESFKVYGEATANSTVVIKDAETGTYYATVKPSGRWYSANITIGTECTRKLVAEVTAAGGGVSASSPILEIEAKAEQLTIVNVKSDSVGMAELPINKVIGARAFTAWVDSSLNGRDISIGTKFDKTIINSVTYHFSGNDYSSTKDGENYYNAVLSGWSGGGLKTITATVITNDGRTLTFIIAEVTVLIDPSGYVFDAETGDRLSDVTVFCETSTNGGTTWTNWDAELYTTGTNPMQTDADGNYGWMVPNGLYRVRAVKTGYNTYLTTSDPDPNISTIVIPPVRMDVNFGMVPNVPMTAITLNNDTLTVNAGSTAQLTATATPTNATNAAKIEWRSSNTSVATVNASGLVTGVSAGTANITAFLTRDSAAELTAVCAVTVAAVSGGSSGGSSGGTAPAEPGTTSSTTTGKTTTVTTTLVGTTSGTTGTTTATVPANTAQTLLNDAKAAESSGQKPVVEFYIPSTGTSTEVVLEIPADSYGKLSGETNADITVKSDIGILTFDYKAVDAIDKASNNGDIKISIEKVDKATLTGEAKEAVGDRPVYEFSVLAGNKNVTDFKGGNVDVKIPYTLKAGEDKNAVVVYYIDSNGKLKNVRGKYNAQSGTVDFKTNHFSKYAVGYNKINFGDVRSNSWYGNAVSFLAARGITTGTSEGTFSPNTKLTRAQFLVMALRAYGIEPDSTSTDNFTDAGKTYYTGYLATAKKLGISNGDGNGKFLPNKDITRQDMFTLLYRTLEVLGELPSSTSSTNISSFDDQGQISSYAKNPMQSLVSAGVVSGSNGKLDPKGQSTRAQMAQVLYNLLSK